MRDRLALTWRLLPVARKLLSYRPDGRLTVTDRIERRAAEHPERPFLLFEGRRWSYGALNAEANRIAHWAWELGIGSGDSVALLMENRPEYVAVWAGLAKVGATTALVNTHLPGRALCHALETSEAATLVVGSECLERLATAESHLEEQRIWVHPDPAEPELPELPRGARDLRAALEGLPDANPDPSEREAVRSGDPLFYIYTSGTTGLPKAARFSHMRFLFAGDSTAHALELREHYVQYCALPLYHSAGGAMLVSSALAAGTTVALRRRFSASEFWDDCRRYGATSFQYIGEFCRYLMNQPPRPDDRDHQVRAIIGNGLRADIWKPFQERFGIERIIEFYAATESNAGIANLENRVGSVGRFPFRFLSNARLVRYDAESDTHPRDERGFCIDCTPGEVGEFLGRIPSSSRSAQGRFEGYTSREATERKILRDVFEKGDAWFRSGDLLRQDEEGFFYFVDRIGDTFRWKGENVSTQEVAEILSGFPGIWMVSVYGVAIPGADGRAGMAAFVPEDRAGFDGKAFYDFVDAHLPRYAAPVFVRLLRDPDVTGTFKLRKVALQSEGFDVEHIEDPVMIRDDEAKTYAPLSADLAAAIRSGDRSL